MAIARWVVDCMVCILFYCYSFLLLFVSIVFRRMHLPDVPVLHLLDALLLYLLDAPVLHLLDALLVASS
jgi:hypothetical protein